MIGKSLLPAALIALAAAAANAQGLALEIYGGTVLPRTETWDDTNYDMDRGRAVGLAVYSGDLLPGYEVGLDIMATDAQYTGYPGEDIETRSIMAMIRRDFEIGPSTAAYAGLGLGAVNNAYNNDGDRTSETVPGAQIALGLRQSLSARVAAFGEVRHQVTSKTATVNGGNEQSYAATAALAGLRIGF